MVGVHLYRLVVRAVEEGVAHGVRQACEADDIELSAEAKAEFQRDILEREVMNALCDVIDFGDDPA